MWDYHKGSKYIHLNTCNQRLNEQGKNQMKTFNQKLARRIVLFMTNLHHPSSIVNHKWLNILSISHLNLDKNKIDITCQK